MSIQRVVLLVFSGCVLLLQNDLSWGQTAKGSAPTVSAGDRKFIVDVAQSGLHEVKLAMLGAEHGANNDLRVYAQKVLDDHTLSNTEVEALARLKGIAFPDPTKTDDPAERLSRLTGIEFDREFIRQEIADHQKNLAEFQKEDQSVGADPDIRNFAHTVLPKVRAHLDQAKALKP
jgi:putative membrane protein